MIEDVVIRFEDPVGEPVVAHELPDIFHRVELRIARAGEPARRRSPESLENLRVHLEPRRVRVRPRFLIDERAADRPRRAT